MEQLLLLLLRLAGRRSITTNFSNETVNGIASNCMRVTQSDATLRSAFVAECTLRTIH